MWRVRLVFDLFTQVADVHGHRRLVAEPTAIVARGAQERLAREDASGRAGQFMQDLELCRSEVDETPPLADPPPLDVDGHVATDDDRGEGSGGIGPVGAAQERAHARHKLAHGERLGHIVIGPEFQTKHAVHLLIARGQEEDRERVGAPEFTAQLETAHVGQAYVEDSHVRRAGGKALQSCSRIWRPVDAPPLALKGVPHALGDRLFILDQEYRVLSHDLKHSVGAAATGRTRLSRLPSPGEKVSDRWISPAPWPPPPRSFPGLTFQHMRQTFHFSPTPQRIGDITVHAQ